MARVATRACALLGAGRVHRLLPMLGVLVGALAVGAAAAVPIVGRVRVPDVAAAHARLPVTVGFFTRSRALLARRDGTLLLSTDGGSSWRRERRLPLRQIDVLGPRLAYATTATAIVKTTDGGSSWDPVARLAGAVVSFAGARHGWIVARAGAFQTADGGRTLQRLSTPCGRVPGEWVALSRVSIRLGFAVCAGEPGAGNQRKRLYVTVDGGRSWRLRTGTGRMPIGGYVSGVSFSSPTAGLMTTVRGSGLLATGDGGRHWRTVLFSPGADVVAAQDLAGGGLAALLSDGALLRSRDGGASWRLLYPHTLPPPALISYSSPRDGIGAGYADWGYSRAAILATTDGGRTWKLRDLLPVDLTPSQLGRASHDVVYLVASSYRRIGSLLLVSGDGGRSWHRLATPAQASFFSVGFPDPRRGLLADNTGGFYATGDGGHHWTLVHAGGPDLRTFMLLTPTVGFALTAPPAGPDLYRTSDGGRSWQPDPTAPLQRPLALATLGSDHVWIVDQPICAAAATRRQPNCPGAIVRSRDGGRSWQRINLNMVPGNQDLDFATVRIGYVDDASGSYHTSDGGRDWTIIP